MCFALIRQISPIYLKSALTNDQPCAIFHTNSSFNVLTRLCFVYSAYMFISDYVTREGANLSEKLTCVYVINKHQMHIYYVIKPIVDETISPQCKHVMSCLA